MGRKRAMTTIGELRKGDVFTASPLPGEVLTKVEPSQLIKNKFEDCSFAVDERNSLWVYQNSLQVEMYW
jgi:hypothetical protein